MRAAWSSWPDPGGAVLWPCPPALPPKGLVKGSWAAGTSWSSQPHLPQFTEEAVTATPQAGVTGARSPQVRGSRDRSLGR